MGLLSFFKKESQIKATAVIVAAGSSTRMGEDKLLMEINDVPVLVHTLTAFENCEIINDIIICCKEGDIPTYNRFCKDYNLTKVSKIILGGSTRSQSVLNGVLEASSPFVAIHDGARPLVTDEIITSTVKTAIRTSAAAPGVAPKDSLKFVDKGLIVKNINRDTVVNVQTPQVFDTDLIKGALTKAIKENIPLTDDCSAVEILNVPVNLTQGSYENIKITTKEDILVATEILWRRENENRPRL